MYNTHTKIFLKIKSYPHIFLFCSFQKKINTLYYTHKVDLFFQLCNTHVYINACHVNITHSRTAIHLRMSHDTRWEQPFGVCHGHIK